MKRGIVPEQRFFRFPQCCTKFEKKINLKKVETLKTIGKVEEASTINRDGGNSKFLRKRD